MKHTLTLTGSTAALAAAMSAFESVEKGVVHDGLTALLMESGKPEQPATPAPMPQPTPAPASSAPAPMSQPTPMPQPTPTPSDAEDDEDEGDATDGSGLDADGLPWDERIHSGSKKRGKDGTWNKRRGGPKGDELTAIEAELRAGAGTQSAPPPPAPMPSNGEAPAPAPMPQPMPSNGEAPAPSAPAPMPTAVPAAQPMPAAAPTPTPAPGAAPTGLDFPTVMQHVGPKMGNGEGQISAEYINRVCSTYGLTVLTDLALKPELIDAVVAQINVDGYW